MGSPCPLFWIPGAVKQWWRRHRPIGQESTTVACLRVVGRFCTPAAQIPFGAEGLRGPSVVGEGASSLRGCLRSSRVDGHVIGGQWACSNPRTTKSRHDRSKRGGNNRHTFVVSTAWGEPTDKKPAHRAGEQKKRDEYEDTRAGAIRGRQAGGERKTRGGQTRPRLLLSFSPTTIRWCALSCATSSSWSSHRSCARRLSCRGGGG